MLRIFLLPNHRPLEDIQRPVLVVMHLILDISYRHTSRLWNQKRAHRSEDHHTGEYAQHARQADFISDGSECECRQDSTGFACCGGDAVGGATDAGREDFDGNQPGGAVRAHVEEELGEGEEGHQAAGGGVAGDTSPCSVEDGDDDTCPELLAGSADEIGERNSEEVAGNVTLIPQR